MARLGDICTVVSGSTPKTDNPEYWDGTLNWITPAELNNDTEIVYESQRKITEEGVHSAGLTSFPSGTVILSSRAPIGKTAIAGTDMYCNQGFKNLICSDAIYNKYLFWFLEKPSDIHGLIYIPFRDNVEETALSLAKELNSKGYSINISRL